VASSRKGPKTLAICNMKGGVGKTATAVNIAGAMAKAGKKILLVDCDFQGNASDYLRLKIPAIINKITMFDGIRLDKPAEDCILPTNFKNLDMVASGPSLSNFNKEGYKVHKVKSWLSSKFVQQKYDYLIFDTRPELGSLFDNVMSYVDWYLVPVFAEADAVGGLQIVFRELREIQEAYNNELKSAGLLISRFSKKNSTHKEFEGVIGNLCTKHDLYLLGKIPMSDALSSSVNKCTPLSFYMENRQSLPIRENFEEVADHLIKNTLVYRKGRVPQVPIISDEEVTETMIVLSESEEMLYE
jgi:chromosome partitioning protein